MRKVSKISGFQVMEYEEVSSTNTVAENMPVQERRDKQVILAYRQTQGRGQTGNSWESAPGQNISMTIILKPEKLDAEKQFAVSMVIALGCLDFIGRYVSGGTVKWPNDVYVGNRKISGILIGHTVAGAYIRDSVCGIGVNINQKEFMSDAPNPVSLWQLTGKELDLNEALEGLLDCIGKRYKQIQNDKLLKQDFMQHLYRGKGTFDWKDENGVFQASIEGIDEYGQLILKDISGRQRTYAFKEVKYL